MNAYELADKLDLEPYGIYGEQAANTLRQQADRIAELEKLVHQRFDDGKRLGVIETEDRLRTNAEPVAWTANKHLTRMADGDDVGLITKTKGTRVGMFPFDNSTDYDIPLYTAPRELSDEEIEVLKEIIRISDRKHPLWDKAKEFLK